MIKILILLLKHWLHDRNVNEKKISNCLVPVFVTKDIYFNYDLTDYKICNVFENLVLSSPSHYDIVNSLVYQVFSITSGRHVKQAY